MRKTISFFNKIELALSLVFICSSAIVLATDTNEKITIPFEYNIIAETKNGEIIDTKATNKLSFKLYQPIDEIYYNNQLVEINDDEFSIDISDLVGDTNIVFKNKANQTASFHYYFSDKNGKVDGYDLVPGKKLNTYVTTIKDIKIIYTDKEKSIIKNINEFINALPQKLLENVKTITLIPFANTNKIAGTTKGNDITLYKFSKYNTKTKKQILYHEITHTWANDLMNKKIIDYSYTKYTEMVNKDKKSVTKYSSNFASNTGRYSEDFAESVALYLISQKNFSKKFPNRANYIQNLLSL